MAGLAAADRPPDPSTSPGSHKRWFSRIHVEKLCYKYWCNGRHSQKPFSYEPARMVEFRERIVNVWYCLNYLKIK